MATNKVSWTVTSQSPSTKFGPDGNPIEGKDVNFETTIGYKGTVFIPDSVYGDPSAVRQMIASEVQTVAAIHGLSGTTG